MQLLAQRGANTPFVGTGVPTVSFSALSSNAIYDMIISYGGGGGGGGWTGNPNQFNANGSYTNIKSGALLTNVTIKASGNAPVFETIAQTPDSGLLFQIDNNTVPGWHFTGDVFGYSGSFIGAFDGNGSGLTNLSTTATLGWGTNIAGAGMVSNSMPVVQINGVLYVPGTLLAGNLASAMNPGTTTIYNIRTDTGTAAGTFIEGSIGLNGTRALGIGGYVNDVGSVSNMTVTAYGGFIVNSNAFLTPPTLAEGDAWFFTSNAIPHVRYRLGGVNITTRLVP